ncbi:MAG: 16S rRNA (cytosine(967)-C(5))-methyltransferase RsmB [Acetivibrio sp.]
MTRELVLEILINVLENGEYSNVAIHNTLMKYQYMEKQNRAFLTRLSEGAIERKMELDYIINTFSKIKVNKMKPVIRNILRMGTYQILYMDQIPDSAACNESVKLANKKGFYNLKGFVNGILRNISRNKENITYPEKGSLEYLSIFYSMPEWIVDLWYKEYGYEQTEGILKGFFEKKQTSIRVNTGKITPQELKVLLEKEEITVTQGQYLPYALQISNYNYIAGLSAFQKGFFQVQDESSMLVASCGGIREGYKILDVCAAPGGKSTHGAELLKGSGNVIARDLTEDKIERIRENIERLGLSNVEAECFDALVLDEKNIENNDIVFADLPCSGLGVMKRKGDIKYKTKEEDIRVLAQLQKDILKVVQQYVKPNGVLLYSTCTINRFENEENIKWFCENFPYELESLDSYITEKLQSETTKQGYLQLLPGIHGTDGFFLARFRKKNEKEKGAKKV